jgi:hypothetical protein
MVHNFGVAPLLVSSLTYIIDVIDDYSRAAEILGRERDARLEEKTLGLSLRTERAKVIDALSTVAKYHIKGILDGTIDLDNHDLAQTLQSTLGISIDPFIVALQELQESVEDMADLLCIGNHEKVSSILPTHLAAAFSNPMSSTPDERLDECICTLPNA